MRFKLFHPEVFVVINHGLKLLFFIIFLSLFVLRKEDIHFEKDRQRGKKF